MLTIARMAITREAINPQCICTPAFDAWYACTSVHIHRSIYHGSRCHAERREKQARVLQRLLTRRARAELFRSCLGAGDQNSRAFEAAVRSSANIKFRFCEFRLGPDQALSFSSSRANANERETGENPKGVLADKRDIDEDARDCKNSDHESGDKPKVHLPTPGHPQAAHIHRSIYITRQRCARAETLSILPAQRPSQKIENFGCVG